MGALRYHPKWLYGWNFGWKKFVEHELIFGLPSKLLTIYGRRAEGLNQRLKLQMC